MNKETRFYYDALKLVKEADPNIMDAIFDEFESQRTRLKLIASENYSSLAVQAAAGNLLTDKYSEGIVGARFYAGCENIDRIELRARDLACKLFGADYACVQPHCGSDANMLAYWMIINARVIAPYLCLKNAKTVSDLTKKEWEELREMCNNQRLLTMDYYSGSHLTHGYRMNMSGQLFDVYTYGVNEQGIIDYDAVEKQALEVQPMILLAGYSAYPRKIDFERFREIADKCGAVLMVDMAHFAGLVAGKVFTDEYNPVPYADVVTSTTHKTLRGPRGGLVLCKNWLKPYAEKACPYMMGGQLPHIVAAKAIAFGEALKPEFHDYAQRIVSNAQMMSGAFKSLKVPVLTGGTDNHMVIINVFKKYGLTGRQAEAALSECNICVNRQAIPNDPNGNWYCSGLRIGTPAITTLGMNGFDVAEIASLIDYVLKNTAKSGKTKYAVDKIVKRSAIKQIEKMLSRKEKMLYPKVNIDKLRKKLYKK